jgi:hypothetical protein
MLRPAAFALVALFCVPASAQQSPPRYVERELLAIEQEVDKALLKEALLQLGHARMKGAPEGKAEAQKYEKEARDLEEYIASKKEAIVARASEMMKAQTDGRPMPPVTQESLAKQAAKRQDTIEKLETGKVDVQVLTAQVNKLRPQLSQAVEELAAADLAASKDETRRAKAEEARKEYEKLKARFVEISKRQQMVQEEIQSLQQSLNTGGFGGGFQ